MKRFLLSVAVVAMVLSGCQKINDAINDLGNRLDKLEQEAIPTIDEQIAAINLSLTSLDAMDKELKGYIDGLTATASNLQEQINNTNTKIGEVKATLQGEISTAKAAVLAQLDAAKTELENELTQINATITTLQEKDVELEGKITELRTYVDTELGKTTDWANATFATLEQYNALVLEVATIKEQIKAINQSIAELETRLTTKINNDIATAVATLNADIQQKVSEITTAYTKAIKSAKEEITAAYTAAIQTAINALDASLKSWVGEQLAGYYTIAESEAKLAALKADLEAQLAVQKTYCESLMTALTNNMTEQVGNLQKQIDAINKTIAELNKEIETLYTKLEQSKTEITTAYTEAIAKAIEENEGKWSNAIAKEVEALNELIEKYNIAAFDAFAEEATSRLEALEADIANILSEIEGIKEDIAKLLARIQSVSYIPTYSDGKATVKYNGDISQVTLDFEISPKDAVAELAKVWKSAVSVKAVYTQTRAVSFIDMPITKFEADATNGVITITASGKNLSEEFFAGTQEASCRMAISDGNNSITSEYIPMVAKYDETIEDDPTILYIYTAQDLAELNSINNAYAKLMATIDMTGVDWTPINGFAGTFDGGNHKIKGLNAPLFGTTQAVSIKNVKLTDVNINATLKDDLYYGALVNKMTTTDATVENCSTSGNMTITLDSPTGNVFMSGVVGGFPDATTDKTYNFTLKDVVSNVNIAVSGTTTKTTNLGGVIGYTGSGNNITFGNLTNNGDLIVEFTSFSGTSPCIGGVIGYLRSKVETTGTSKVLNNGALTIGNGTTKKIALGGVVGLINIAYISVKNFHNRGNLTVDGLTATSWFNIGGITSYNQNTATYENVRNDGDITIKNSASAGIACFDVGGILGTVQNTTTFNGDIINTGNITVENHNSSNTRWVGIAGIMGGDDNKTLTINGNLSNSGTVKVVGGDFSGLEVPFGIGGICGYMRKEVKNATNTGDVICATISDTANTFIGGLVGATTAPINGARCYCDIIALNGAKVGFITGSPYSETINSTNCHIGGKIATTLDVIEDGPAWTLLDDWLFIDFIYGEPISTEQATAGKLGWLEKNIDSTPIGADGAPIVEQ